MTEETTPIDPKTILGNLHREYTGKEAPAGATSQQIRQAIQATEEFKRIFASKKDEGLTLDDMLLRQLPGQEVAAWLINADYENSFRGKSKGRGALFRLPDGRSRFVDLSGPMANAPPVMTEFVFPNVTVIRDVAAGTEDYDFRGAKPIQKKHGRTPPASDLTKPLSDCWKYVAKKGCVTGESYEPVFALLAIADDEDDIAYFPPNEWSDKATLRFHAVDAVGNTVRVEADPEEVSKQLGIPIDSPAKVWKSRMRGRQVAANGTLSVFLERGDSFFGRDGALAEFASAQGSRIEAIQKAKDPNKSSLNLKDIYNAETNKTPAVQIGDKWVYRMESFSNRDGGVQWKAWVRADAEVDNRGRPMPPQMDCVVKRGNKNGKDWEMNSGSYVLFPGSDEPRKASATAQRLLLAD